MAEANRMRQESLREVEIKKKCEMLKKTYEKPQKCAADGGRDDSNVLLYTYTHTHSHTHLCANMCRPAVKIMKHCTNFQLQSQRCDVDRHTGVVRSGGRVK